MTIHAPGNRRVLEPVYRSRGKALPGAAQMLTLPDLTTLEDWDNEGGAASPGAIARNAEQVRPAAPIRQAPPLRSAFQCRRRANRDLARAASTESLRSRRQLERSAAQWTHRGDTLQRLEILRRESGPGKAEGSSCTAS